MLTLYGFLRSGNVYKVRLLLAQLGIPHRRVEVSQLTADTARPEFRAINPTGKVPTVVFDDGRMLSENGAILHYLAGGSRFWPVDRWQQAQVLRRMFFEQYSHEPAIAVMDAHFAGASSFGGEASPSPTSHSMPIPTSPAKAGSILHHSPMSGSGWDAAVINPATSC